MILSDGGAMLGRDPIAALSALASSAMDGPTWSGVTLGRGTVPAERLEGMAWLGHGWHAYADSPYEADQVLISRRRRRPRRRS